MSKLTEQEKSDRRGSIIFWSFISLATTPVLLVFVVPLWLIGFVAIMAYYEQGWHKSK
ncbi:hypothetical protein [Acinetobacter sp.]|uniref:hypothetical protein n=1 Tax=Acinetobacter sp. TaxID=472 RepID=UPI003CFF2926